MDQEAGYGPDHSESVKVNSGAAIGIQYTSATGWH